MIMISAKISFRPRLSIKLHGVTNQNTIKLLFRDMQILKLPVNYDFMLIKNAPTTFFLFDKPL
jgi:hypothetical protein